MKKIIFSLALMVAASGIAIAQDISKTELSATVKSALMKKYPQASKVTWEKEKGNYEANWGGKSGEDMSVQFTPAGVFVEQVVAISPKALPAGVDTYVKAHYKGVKITEAGKVTNAKGVTMYEAEVKGKDLLFDESGKFLKVD
jgi:hypothetical protein